MVAATKAPETLGCNVGDSVGVVVTTHGRTIRRTSIKVACRPTLVTARSLISRVCSLDTKTSISFGSVDIKEVHLSTTHVCTKLARLSR